MQLNIMRSFSKGDVTRSTLPEEELNIDTSNASFARGPAVSAPRRLNGTALYPRKLSTECV